MGLTIHYTLKSKVHPSRPGTKQAGLAQVEVKDDGGYWERCGPKELAETDEHWNGVNHLFAEE